MRKIAVILGAGMVLFWCGVSLAAPKLPELSAYKTASLWDETGNFRRADRVPDSALVSALEGSDAATRAMALGVLSDRVVDETYTPFLRIRWVQHTDRAVGVALAKSGMMTSANPLERASALRAAAAVPDAADVLAPQIRAALEKNFSPDISEVDQKLRARAAAVGAGDLFEATDPKPGVKDYQIRGAAAKAAAALGKVGSVQFVEAIGADVSAATAPQSGYVILAIARSDRGDNFVDALARNDGDLTQLILAAPRVGPQMASSLDRLCGQENKGTAPLVCDVVAWRRGDHAAIERVSARLEGQSFDAYYAANALLNEFGLEGLAVLRGRAGTSKPNFSAVRELCRLGRNEAGEDVVNSARALAGEGPNNETILRWCLAPERQMSGRFAPGFTSEGEAGLYAKE